MRMLRARPPILFLLLAFVAGSFGLPLADAIIFHGQPGATPAAERILSAGPQAPSHVQLCSLEQAPAAKFAALSWTAGIERLPADHPVVRRPDQGLAPAGARVTSLHSRAPPSA